MTCSSVFLTWGEEDFPLYAFPRLTHYGFASLDGRHGVENHCHFGYEFAYIEAGSADRVLNELEAPLLVKAEDLIITAPLVEHTFRLEPHDLEMKWLGF